jgi:hypothetical protein
MQEARAAAASGGHISYAPIVIAFRHATYMVGAQWMRQWINQTSRSERIHAPRYVLMHRAAVAIGHCIGVVQTWV